MAKHQASDSVHPTRIALYIDLENVPKGVDLDGLMRRLADPGESHYFVVKAAYGTVAQLTAGLRDQLRDHNFQIVETPHVANRKNRADLIISLDAFEKHHIGVPPIDRYVFVTSDSDFSVVMDKLRTYGKQVWLVGHRSDEMKKVLVRSADRVLFIEHFVAGQTAGSRPAVPPIVRFFHEVLAPHDLKRHPMTLGDLGMAIRRKDRQFRPASHGFSQLKRLVLHLAECGLLKIKESGKDVLVVGIDLSLFGGELDRDSAPQSDEFMESPRPEPRPLLEYLNGVEQNQWDRSKR